MSLFLLSVVGDHNFRWWPDFGIETETRLDRYPTETETSIFGRNDVSRFLPFNKSSSKLHFLFETTFDLPIPHYDVGTNYSKKKKLVAASSDSKLFSQTLQTETTRRYFGNFWTNRKHNYYHCPVLLHQLKNLRRGLRTSFKMKKCDDSRLFGIRSFSCALTYHLYLPIVCGLFYKRLPKFCPSMIKFCYHCSKMSFCWWCWVLASQHFSN